jgi:lysozyme family protein
MPALTEAFKLEYQHLFDSCQINSNRYPVITRCVQAIANGKPQYDAIATHTGIPWYFIGIVHKMECDCNFSKHLHNGDPLTARTLQVPKGRPKTGNAPFTFFDSAVDALTLEGFTQWNDWSISGMLYCFERYNGFGYRSKGIHSPYLWSFSNHYTKGKFVKDGVFNSNAVSEQIGTAVLLRRMSELQLAIAGEKDLLTQIKELGPQVVFDPDHYRAAAERLQRLLNSVGQHLKTDGKAGRNTSDAYQRITGKYLKGDSKQ